ncbi:response regulator transcription factor [Limnohabitans sp.]|jgi:two-component system OmpR family response regulator|uniref:response regulator transcription factor n=1 Tax=Limnohabitans sp. TaxID=1907725 RepID=UPI00286F7443|nr:response regulator transcription factor [Limnohabitans sp.]
MVDLKILLIEDEGKIAEFVIKGLSAAGYDVTHLDDGERGLAAVLEGAHDLVILDVMLPKLNGFELLHQARMAGMTTPVIILSAKVDLPDRLMGFEMGADDYLPKPFFVEEMVARIKAVMQRKMPDQVQQISLSHLTLDVVSHKVQWFDVTAVLSQREFSLLAFLMRSPGHIFSRQQILKHVWEINFDPETNVVDVCVRRIKRKLERGRDGHASPIESVRGVGYRLRLEA